MSLLQPKDGSCKKTCFLGIDIGSVTVKTALIDSSRALLSETYTRLKGEPAQVLMQELTGVFRQFPEARIAAAGITGSGGKQIAAALSELALSMKFLRKPNLPDASIRKRDRLSRWAERTPS